MDDLSPGKGIGRSKVSLHWSTHHRSFTTGVWQNIRNILLSRCHQMMCQRQLGALLGH